MTRPDGQGRRDVVAELERAVAQLRVAVIALVVVVILNLAAHVLVWWSA